MLGRPLIFRRRRRLRRRAVGAAFGGGRRLAARLRAAVYSLTARLTRASLIIMMRVSKSLPIRGHRPAPVPPLPVHGPLGKGLINLFSWSGATHNLFFITPTLQNALRLVPITRFDCATLVTSRSKTLPRAPKPQRI